MAHSFLLNLPLLACFIKNSVWLSFSWASIRFFLRPHGQCFLELYPSLCILLLPLLWRHFIRRGILRPYSWTHWYLCLQKIQIHPSKYRKHKFTQFFLEKEFQLYRETDFDHDEEWIFTNFCTSTLYFEYKDHSLHRLHLTCPRLQGGWFSGLAHSLKILFCFGVAYFM